MPAITSNESPPLKILFQTSKKDAILGIYHKLWLFHTRGSDTVKLTKKKTQVVEKTQTVENHRWRQNADGVKTQAVDKTQTATKSRD